MPASRTFIITGGGLAGTKTAEALREQGFDGRIVPAAEEDIRPCERPPLSKDYLQGKAQRDTIVVHSPDWHDAKGVELLLGTAVTGIDRGRREVTLSGGGTSDPAIYAAGDVASAFHPVLGTHIRVEHWANALHQPRTATAAMLGRVIAGMNVNIWDVNDAIQDLIRSGQAVAPARLADSGVPLGEVTATRNRKSSCQPGRIVVKDEETEAHDGR